MPAKSFLTQDFDLKAAADSILKKLATNHGGLSSIDAIRRLEQYGPNQTGVQEKNPLLKDIFYFCSNPLVIILILAAIASGSLGQTVDATLIIAMVSISVVLNVVQTFRSRQAVQILQSSMAPTATALRDGKWITVDRKSIVPGDIVQVRAGDVVPADCRLLTANDLHVQQAALTGESLPVDKRADLNELKSAEPAENEACLFLGTSVVSGVGTAVCVLTGANTVFGDVATRLAQKAPETDFERGLRQFGMLILKTVIFLLLFVFLASVVMKRNPLESLLFSVALAVGLTPEFLPMITTITLSRGAVHMSKQGVIVKNLASIQNFGSMNILCSDKTGTLTTGQMTLDQVVDPFGASSDQILPMAQINSRLETGIDSSLDSAILVKGNEPTGATKLGEIPFDFERRRMSVVAEVDGKPVLICKGSPEGVIAACRQVTRETGSTAFDATSTAQCQKTYEDLSAQGYRVLAVATKTVPKQDDYSVEDERDLNLLGFLAFIDPLLPEAMQTIENMRKTGVDVKIISGDNQLVTEHVCRKVGLDPGKIILGEDIQSMSDVALQHVAEESRVFARVSPSQKNRIILALKARGHVVGYMGDGINDAPSLHAADVGISVASAVDVAKDAADIILVNPGLAVLQEGVIEGRMAFGNVMKYLLMGTSSNFGNMFSMAGAAMFLPFLPMLPTQILLNNFLYDLSQVTIPTDTVDPEYAAKPRRWDIGMIRDFMIIIGPLSSIYDFLTFYVLLKVFNAREKEFHTGWFVESLATQVLVILVIRTAKAPWKSRPSRPLEITTVLVVAVACILPYSPLGPLLGFVPLPIGFFGFLVGAVITYLILVEWVKQKIFARWSKA